MNVSFSQFTNIFSSLNSLILFVNIHNTNSLFTNSTKKYQQKKPVKLMRKGKRLSFFYIE